MFEHWRKDQEENLETLKHQSILTGYFYNPELAQEMLKTDDNAYVSSERDFEDSFKMTEQPPISKKRKKKKLMTKD